MKNFLLLLTILILGSLRLVIAQYNGVVNTDVSEITSEIQSSYDVIKFSEEYFTEELGKPQLPVKALKYIIPVDKKVSNVIINSSNKQVLSDTYDIFPAQPPVIFGKYEPFIEPDSTIYNSITPYPNKLVEIITDDFIMGYRIVTLRFYPLEYIPIQKKINLYTSINFTIELVDNLDPIVLPKKQSRFRYELVKSFIKTSITNPDDFETSGGGALQIIPVSISEKSLNFGTSPSLIGTIPDYVIITNNRDIDGNDLDTLNGKNMVQTFHVLADWKTRKGIPAIVITTDEISINYPGCDLSEKIRNYLIDAYENWGSLFILLGGDVNIIPARYGLNNGKNVTDLYYATTSGIWNPNGNDIFGEYSESVDQNPEHFLGRASVENIAEAQTFINKVIEYEKINNPTINTDYVKNVLLVGPTYKHDDSDPDPQPYGQQVQTEVYDSTLSSDIKAHTWRMYDEFTPYFLLDSNFEEILNKANLLAAMQNGGNSGLGYFHIISHYDHGNPYSIGASSSIQHELIYRQDVDTLTNGPHYQILFNQSCEPNEFNKDCFGEHYINNPNGAGVAYMGNSAMASGAPNFCKKRFKAFFNSLYNIGNNPYYNGGYYLGIAFVKAGQNGNSSNPSDKLFNLLGDPEMPIWTNTPDTFIVSYNTDTISNVNNHLTITVSNLTDSIDVTVCLYKENEVYAYQTIFSSGTQEVFDFDIAPNTPGNLDITVTAHNYIPYEDLIPVNITGSHLYISETLINDTIGGNTDLKIDARETIAEK
ncbi:MAG: hypothetical protein HY738_06275 [Bacteroidia bacterium]|nr:hypothetical protein [Bacteroidia bacterium]